MGFVTTDPVTGLAEELQSERASAIELEASSPAIVRADGWLPDVVVQDIRAAVRVSSAAEPRLRDAIRFAIISVRRELADWTAARKAEGRLSLKAVPCDQIDGQSILVRLYFRAVASLTAADLVETHLDATATDRGVDRAEVRAIPADDHRRNALWAIRDILAVTRTTVELI